MVIENGAAARTGHSDGSDSTFAGRSYDSGDRVIAAAGLFFSISFMLSRDLHLGIFWLPVHEPVQQGEQREANPVQDQPSR